LKFKLAHDRRKVEAKWSKQVRPYYWPSLQTHDGIALGTRFGPLKLVLHPFVSYANLPNQKTPHFSINSLGFRGGDIRKDEKTKKRIIVVGGSTAFGTGLQYDDETLARRLEYLLDAEVINAAVADLNCNPRAGRDLCPYAANFAVPFTRSCMAQFGELD
jgi:hypothetical protein